MRWALGVDGRLLGSDDPIVLAAAKEAGLTLVTYDTQILAEQAELYSSGQPFAGIVLIDRKTIEPVEFGALVQALISLWDRESSLDWTCRLVWLTRGGDES